MGPCVRKMKNRISRKRILIPAGFTFIFICILILLRLQLPNDPIVALAITLPTLAFTVYMIVVLYRCFCTRNYAEWRSSWSDAFKLRRTFGRGSGPRNLDYLFNDPLPIYVDAYQDEEEVDLLASGPEAEPLVATCSVLGDIKVWDSRSGECYCSIKRFKTDDEIDKQQQQDNYKANGAIPKRRNPSLPNNNSTPLRRRQSSGSPTTGPTPGTSGSNSTTPNVASPMSPNISFSTGQNANEIFKAGKPTARKSIIADIMREAATMIDKPQTSGTSEDFEPVRRKVHSPHSYSPVWSMDLSASQVFLGCGSGRIEVWPILGGNWQASFINDQSSSGVTQIKAQAGKMIVGRLNGDVEFYIQTSGQSSTARHHTHAYQLHQQQQQQGSSSGNVQESLQSSSFMLIGRIKAHNQPVSKIALLISSHLPEGGPDLAAARKSSNTENIILSGSEDHVIKIYTLSDFSARCRYVLHGHCGGISALIIDRFSRHPSAVSGCKVGQLCVWDLATGTCEVSVETAHRESPLTQLTTTRDYLVSGGSDNRTCVWDKTSGRLLRTIPGIHNLCMTSMVAPAPNILVLPKETDLLLYDVCDGNILKIISLEVGGGGAVCGARLAGSPGGPLAAAAGVAAGVGPGAVGGLMTEEEGRQHLIRNLILIGTQTVACDFGSRLCLIQFPSIDQKYD